MLDQFALRLILSRALVHYYAQMGRILSRDVVKYSQYQSLNIFEGQIPNASGREPLSLRIDGARLWALSGSKA